MPKLAILAPLALCSAATAPAAACSEPPAQFPAQANDEGRPVSNLPHARGKTFRTLDEYLAHLQQMGAIDLPYWRQVGPNLYERVTTMRPRGEPERATRAELMERYGFTR